MSVAEVVAEMNVTYADCDDSNSDGMEERRLDWRADEAIPLDEVDKAYGMIEGYNEFGPEVIENLQAEFEGQEFMVTCARESSVCLYLHIGPAADKDAVREFCSKALEADEVDWCSELGGRDGDVASFRGKIADPTRTLRIWWD